MFTALVPPPTALGDLEEFVVPRRDADPAVRWTHLDSWHVTTAFAASVPGRSHDRLVEALREAASRIAPLEVRLEGGLALPNPAQARVLSLAASPEEPLAAIAAASRTAFARSGIEVDGAKFRPHLTLARMRRPIEATKWLRVLDACPPASWRAKELLLIESHLRDAADRYEVVGRFRFGA